MATQDDIARLLDELVRLQAVGIRRRSTNQVEAILELSKAGLPPKRVSELLGTTPGTVTVTLAKAKKRQAKPTTKKESEA